MCHSATRTAPGAGRAGDGRATRGRAGRRDRDGAEAGEHHREQHAKAHIVEYVSGGRNLTRAFRKWARSGSQGPRIARAHPGKIARPMTPTAPDAEEPHRLTLEEARRIAVGAQMLGAERPAGLLALVERLTFLQLDPTAAIAPSADLVAWSRLGAAYDARGAAHRARARSHAVRAQRAGAPDRATCACTSPT